jgi:TPR repeat protein
VAAKSDVVAERPLPSVASPQPATIVAALPTRDATSPEIEACDRAAASPHDKEKPANIPGVEYKALAGQTGVLSCLKAAQASDAPRRIPFQLGRAYSKIGNNRDAAQSYVKAANLKHPIAMHNLAAMHSRGEGVPRDYSTARVLYESAAAAGIHESLNEVGALYELGRGAPRDYNKAKFYYEKAIAAGDPAANSRLGGMYVNGAGVRKDMAKACELFRTAAAMGNADGAKNARRFCGR